MYQHPGSPRVQAALPRHPSLHAGARRPRSPRCWRVHEGERAVQLQHRPALWELSLLLLSLWNSCLIPSCNYVLKFIRIIKPNEKGKCLSLFETEKKYVKEITTSSYYRVRKISFYGGKIESEVSGPFKATQWGMTQILAREGPSAIPLSTPPWCLKRSEPSGEEGLTVCVRGDSSGITPSRADRCAWARSPQDLGQCPPGKRQEVWKTWVLLWPWPL